MCVCRCLFRGAVRRRHAAFLWGRRAASALHSVSHPDTKTFRLAVSAVTGAAVAAAAPAGASTAAVAVAIWCFVHARARAAAALRVLSRGARRACGGGGPDGAVVDGDVPSDPGSPGHASALTDCTSTVWMS